MGVHDGHRERLRRRFVSEGAKSFEPHNLLELLLFYAVPRRDTNVTAHLLLERFGDVPSVLTAPVPELCKVAGIGESSAVLLRLCGELGTRLCAGTMKNPKRFRTREEIGEYLVGLYRGVRVETVYALLLSGSGTLIRAAQVCAGGVSSAVVRVRDIVSAAMSAGAGAVVLAHNHPGGTAFPSLEDLNATQEIARALSLSGIELAEHFVVADDAFRGVLCDCRKAGEMRLRQSFFLDDGD